MTSRLVMIVLCTSGLVYAAAFPTQNEYVTVADNSLKSTTSSFDTSTEQPNAPIKMTEMRVRSDIALRYARTSVITHVRNPGRQPQEAVFRMLLPETAFISGFTMILGGKSYKAYVKGKQEAKQIYTQAVSQGVGAAHIATKARDSNHFMVTVNVEGNSTAIFDLRYEEFLVRRNGVYNHAINLHPGVLVPTMEIVVHIKEAQKITKLNVPEVRTGNEIDATQKDPQNSKAVIEKNSNDQEVTVTFTPDLPEQRRLAGIYVDKSKHKSASERFLGNDDSNEEDGTVLGQFVVQYDVERTKNGEILVNDGYFVHFLAPSSLPPLSKYVVFVLDTSGSMGGRKIEQLRHAMESILSDLNPNDYFSIVEFNSYVKVHDLKETEQPHGYTYMYSNQISQAPPTFASLENVAKARIIVSRLMASGGTSIYSALNVALDLVKKGVHQENKTNSISEIANELESVIIFLTDGDPNIGETSTDRIVSLISEQNTGDKRASLYSLALGEDADRTFLRKLSLRNEGFMRHIYEASDAALQLHDFYRQVSSPLLAHVQFLYPSEQIKEGTVSRHEFRTVNAGSEVTIVGQVADDATEITPQVLGYRSNEDGIGRKRYEILPRSIVIRDKDEYLPLERLWAYLTIKQLLDKRDANVDSGAGENSPEKKALDIALKYAFVTPLTSLVVVKPNETNAVDVESVDKQPQAPVIAYKPVSVPVAAAPRYNDWSPSYSNRISGGFSRINNIGNSRSNANTISMGDNYNSGRANTNRISMRNDYSGGWHNRMYDSRADDSYESNSYGRRLYGGTSHRYKSNGWWSNGYFDSDSDDNDSDENTYSSWSGPRSFDFVRPFTKSVRPTVVSTTPRATTTVSHKGNYHLEGFEWTASLLDTHSDALVFEENGTQIVLQLTKDINPPKTDGGDDECLNSKSMASVSVAGDSQNTGSVCVYLTRCFAARNITANEYKKSSCFVNNSFAGVCCPRNEVDKNP